MEFDFALAQDIGTRKEQQDSAAVCPFEQAHGTLLVIADGLGGHTGGARASHIVVKTFLDAGESGRFKSPQNRYEQLGATLSAANEEIAAAASGLAKNESMGTTLVAAAAAWNSLGWISVGDSHLYLWRGGTLTKLNEDHSQAGQMIKSGRYQPDDPELDAYRSMLRSAILGRELTLIDRPIETRSLEKGDVLVLATDGLNVVDTPEVERIIAEQAPRGAEQAANALLDAVRASTVPSRDNATVIVARVLALDRDEKAPATEVASRSANGHLVEPEVVVTTAIVTTPFYRTAKPIQGGQPAGIQQAASQQPGEVAEPAAASPAKPSQKSAGAKPRVPPPAHVAEASAVASVSPDFDERPRGKGLWYAILLIAAVLAAAGGYLARRWFTGGV